MSEEFELPSSSVSPNLVWAFARLVTHGHGGTFRLSLRDLQDMGDVRVTQTHDEQTGDYIFTVTEVAR